MVGPGPAAKPRFCPGGIGDPPRQVESISGSYRYVRNGKRYKQGELPREDPLVFKDGVIQPQQ